MGGGESCTTWPSSRPLQLPPGCDVTTGGHNPRKSHVGAQLVTVLQIGTQLQHRGGEEGGEERGSNQRQGEKERRRGAQSQEGASKEAAGPESREREGVGEERSCHKEHQVG